MHMAKKYIIALDVGGSKIFSGMVSAGKVSKTNKIHSGAHEGKDALVANIVDAITALKPESAAKICIGIAGQLDTERKVLVQSPNFADDTKHLPLKLLLQKKFKKPIFLENDANCFTLGEALLGAGKDKKSVIGVTLGTGIGGGIVINPAPFGKTGAVIDKKLILGSNGSAGEFGHTIIVPNGEPCSCRGRGHFESYVGGRAISAAYKKLTERELFFSDIFDRSLKNDLNAKKVITEAQMYLAALFVNIIHSLNPEIIVVGGGLGTYEAFWRPAAMQALNQVFLPALRETLIVPAKLGDNAALLGASLLK